MITIRVATQVIEHFRDVANVLGLPHSRVRIIAPYIGGGFGGKEDVTVEVFLGLLVWKTTRPVRLCYSREESILSPTKRHPFIMRYKHGARRDGTLVALEVELISDAGAYAYLSPLTLLYGMVHAAGPYRIPHVKVDGVSVLTNNPPTSAFRGFGSAQPAFAYESQMDELARALGLDPLAFRERNYLGKGERLASGQELETAVWLPETARRAWDALGPAARALGPRQARRAGRRVGAHVVRADRLAPRLVERVGGAPDGRHGPGPDRRPRHRRRPGGLARADHGGDPRRAPGGHRRSTSATRRSRRSRAPRPRPGSSTCRAPRSTRRRASCGRRSSPRRPSCSACAPDAVELADGVAAPRGRAG